MSGKFNDLSQKHIVITIISEDIINTNDLVSILTKNTDIQIVTQFDTGATAIASCQVAMPDIIFFDRSISDMSEIELVRLVKKIRPSCRFIGATHSPDADWIRELILLGIYNMISKPYAEDSVYKAIQNVITENPL
jgi:DNA-binding NarL/FixJ family response regulator